MTDSLAKPANLPEPLYTPEKGGWKWWEGSDDVAADWQKGGHSILLRCGETSDWFYRWDHQDSPADIIAYLAKPACICRWMQDAEFGVAPDCPACNRVGEGERQHVMPGDPANICGIALQWYLRFDFGYPHSVRESNIAVEGFKDGYRAAIAAIEPSDHLTEQETGQ